MSGSAGLSVARPLRRYVGATTVQDRSRVLVKTLCYRLLMVLVTVSVTLAVTGDLVAALNVGLVANVVKTMTYYGYERLWDRVTWGLQ